ncbi:hypothetical protein BH11ACT8_BH11ACT8_22390 [soil metagenome]
MSSSKQSPFSGPVVGAVSGVVLLGAVTAFSVGLTNAEGGSATLPGETASTSATASGGTVELPEALPGGLISVDSDQMPSDLVDQLGGPDDLRRSLDSASAGVTDLFGSPSVLGLYGRTDASVLVRVVVAPGDPGLFLPEQFLPIAPDVLGVARAPQVLEKVDGAVCFETYAQPVAAGTAVDPGEVPQSVICQLGADGRTFQISGGGLDAAASVTALHALAAYVGGDASAVPDAADEVVPPAPAAPTTPAPAPQTTPAPAPQTTPQTTPETAPTTPAPTR